MELPPLINLQGSPSVAMALRVLKSSDDFRSEKKIQYPAGALSSHWLTSLLFINKQNEKLHCLHSERYRAET